jgi:hypothetical protein
MVFGFALCPYLDRTFHRVRREARGAEGQAAFALGFGVFFLVMILMTLGYSGALLALPSGAPMPSLTAHWTVQALFTVVAHLTPVAVGVGALRRGGSAAAHARLWRRSAMLFVSAAGVALAGFILLPGFDLSRLSDAEVVYRCFMGFYGLVFPAYVWLVMIPTRDGHSGLRGEAGRRKLLIGAAAVGIAAPMFWMGFVRQQEFWLVPGLGVVLGARLVLPRGGRSEDRGGEGVAGA